MILYDIPAIQLCNSGELSCLSFVNYWVVKLVVLTKVPRRRSASSPMRPPWHPIQLQNLDEAEHASNSSLDWKFLGRNLILCMR